MKPFRYRLPEDLASDIEAYAGEVERFLDGSLPGGVFKAKRVPRGVYEQRRDGAFMLRVRVAGGVLSARQAGALAALGREYGNGRLHVTTRQDVQIHDVAIKDTPAIMRRLMSAGLTSKGGGGNTVRNVTACPYAGVCPAERFDVTPAAHAVTEYLIALTGSYNLPRKYKIAFSGCAADCALAQVADLGFIAAIRDGSPGFRVLAGGGMGARSRIADTLLEWTPACEAIRVAETVRRLFDRFGDRRDRHRARLRFVFERMGVAGFRKQFAASMEKIKDEGVPEWRPGGLMQINASGGVETPPSPVAPEGVRAIPQRQSGFYALPLHAPLGFLPAGDFARMGELAARFSGEKGLRTTISQNLLIRFVKKDDLAALVSGLRELETDVLASVPLERFVACAGASTCRLGICLARRAAKACAKTLETNGVSRDTLETLRFHINGCPNACGQQPVASIGFFGAALRNGGRLAPSYTVTLGGYCGARGARLGEPVGKIPAAALPAYVRELAADFDAGRERGESFAEYFERLGAARFEAMAAGYSRIPGYAENPEFYRDLGAGEDFSLAGRGAGECGAGVFEVIQSDLDAAGRADTPFDVLIPATRALLITRGVDAQDAGVVLREFERHFIDTGLVAGEFSPLLDRAREYLQGRRDALDGMNSAVARLRARVGLLYSTLDAGLVFHPPDGERPPAPQPGTDSSGGRRDASASGATAGLDLSGVACPMNFVKAKLKLETMNAGDTLSIILDEGEPVRNVPASFKNEGQAILDLTDIGNGRWRVVVEKLV